MKNPPKTVSPPLSPNSQVKDISDKDLPPVKASVFSSVRVTLPDGEGNAIGMNVGSDTGGVAVTSAPHGNAKLVRYGVAYAANNGIAEAAASGAAVAHEGGDAMSGDGGVSYAWKGTAGTFRWGTAFAIEGKSVVHDDGVAVVLLNGTASVNEGGVACALNFKRQDGNMVTDPTAGKVSGGVGGVVVAFTSDEAMGTPRRPVVGVIGERPDFLNEIPDLEARLLACGVQFGLKAGKPYGLNPKTGKLEEVTGAK